MLSEVGFIKRELHESVIFFLHIRFFSPQACLSHIFGFLRRSLWCCRALGPSRSLSSSGVWMRERAARRLPGCPPILPAWFLATASGRVWPGSTQSHLRSFPSWGGREVWKRLFNTNAPVAFIIKSAWAGLHTVFWQLRLHRTVYGSTVIGVRVGG